MYTTERQERPIRLHIILMACRKGCFRSRLARTRIKSARAILAFCLILKISHAVGADSVILNSGGQVDGAVIAQTKDFVRISTKNGIKTIPKATIRRILFGSTRNNAAKRDAAPPKPAPARQAGEKMAPGRKATERSFTAGRDKETAGPGSRAASPLGSAWRSALLPGWGQTAAGDPAAGFRIGAGFLASAAYAGNRWGAQQDARRAYGRQARDGSFVIFERLVRTQGADELKLPLTALHVALTSAAKNPYHTRVREFGQSLSILAFVYLAQIVHAAWSGTPTGVVSSVVPVADGAVTLTVMSCDWFSDTRRSYSAGGKPIAFAVSVRF